MPESMQRQREMLVALRRVAEQRAIAETDAMMRLEKEKAACQSSRSESRKKADENLGETKQAMERASVVLAHAGLQKALVKSERRRPTIGSDDHAVQELADAVALANRAYQNIHENANRLQSCRLLWARRRRLLFVLIEIVVAVTGVIAAWGFLYQKIQTGTENLGSRPQGDLAVRTTAPTTRMATATETVPKSPVTRTPVQGVAEPVLPTNLPSTVIPIPTVAPIPTLTASATPCARPTGLFVNLWAKYHTRLGCPLGQWQSDRDFPPYTFAEQPFEHGHMFIYEPDDESTPQVYVVLESGQGKGAWTGSGTWKAYPSAWHKGDPDYSCDRERPYPQQPIQGFGRIWCDYSEVRHGLGWGVDRMRDQDRESPGASVYRLQKFTGGFVFRDSDGWTHHLAYVFFDSGKFVRDSYTSP